MKFKLQRRVDALTPDEIDRKIEEQQNKALTLVHELEQTLEAQAELWRRVKEQDDG